MPNASSRSKVIVAMSGGVDSSVAAALLVEQGYTVEGAFMKNWTPESSQSLTDCPWLKDQEDASAVCKTLDIPFRSVNFEKEYKEKVVDYFLEEYAAGRTPNPDVMCNKEIKFKAFLDMAMSLGADYIATGHYARILDDDGQLHLSRGLDGGKDQSYFLWTLTGAVLEKILFPVGELPKSTVRQIAGKIGLLNAEKKDSQGICFIGHLDLKQFLKEQIGARAGEVYIVQRYHEGVNKVERLSDVQLVGKHCGSMYYTIGERAGGIIDNKLFAQARGEKNIPSTYVLAKDIERNIVYITDDAHDPDLCSTRLVITDGWLDDKAGVHLTCQIRYQQKERLEIEKLEGGVIFLKQPAWAAAAGQSAVIYKGDMIVGGGILV